MWRVVRRMVWGVGSLWWAVLEEWVLGGLGEARECVLWSFLHAVRLTDVKRMTADSIQILTRREYDTAGEQGGVAA